MEPSEVLRLKQALALDAANAAGDRESTAWLEPEMCIRDRIQRFGNWPRALTAAGLKRPREQRRADNRRRNEEALRRRKAQELSGQAAAKEAGLTTKTEGEA